MTIQPANDGGSNGGGGAWFPTDVDAAGALTTLVTAVTTSMNVAEQEETKRAAIAGSVRINLEAIRSAERVLLAYLQQASLERGQVFDRLFDSLDKAHERGDSALATSALQSIVDLAKQTPLKDALNLASIRAQLAGGYVDLTGGLDGQPPSD